MSLKLLNGSNTILNNYPKKEGEMKKLFMILPLVLVLCFAYGCEKEDDDVAVMETKEEVTSGSINVDGFELSYEIEGDGIPCFVIGSSIYYPRTFSQELRKHFKFIFLDLRHFVPSDVTFEIDNITLDTYSDDIDQVRKALGFNKICILGHSIHSLLAYEYACKYPENTSHVIMIGIFPCGIAKGSRASNEFWESDASDERKMILKRNWENVTDELMNNLSFSDAFIKRYITNGPKYWHDPTYNCSWIWEGVEFNMDIWNHLLSAIFNEYDVTDSFPRIKAPAFLALGRYDYVCPYILWDGVKDNFPNLSYHLFEKSGHTPQLEEQELFDKKLIDWIKNK
jgi:proline iminopeptidase